mmetsp:Transcript_47908/g.120594  ORF Transcript_47908/g.120594 Transcript_47908/m.120594 type:complete len:214 (+) Transcript_47908:1096-1737(+)
MVEVARSSSLVFDDQHIGHLCNSVQITIHLTCFAVRLGARPFSTRFALFGRRGTRLASGRRSVFGAGGSFLGTRRSGRATVLLLGGGLLRGTRSRRGPALSRRRAFRAHSTGVGGWDDRRREISAEQLSARSLLKQSTLILNAVRSDVGVGFLLVQLLGFGNHAAQISQLGLELVGQTLQTVEHVYRGVRHQRCRCFAFGCVLSCERGERCWS